MAKAGCCVLDAGPPPAIQGLSGVGSSRYVPLSSISSTSEPAKEDFVVGEALLGLASSLSVLALPSPYSESQKV